MKTQTSANKRPGKSVARALARLATILGVAALPLLLGSVIPAPVAQATFPGVNGRIAFRRGGDIYAMSADGSNQTNLSNNPYSNAYPSWSPDGTKIAFSSDRDGPDFPFNFEVYVMNADGSNQTRLTNSPQFDDFPSWSPNGTKIAFRSNRDGNSEIYVMNADGSNPTNLTNNVQFDDLPNWSPDGTKIAFRTNRDGNLEIYVMNADGSNPTRLTNHSAIDVSPSWSPDGAKIAFTSLRDGFDNIYVMNADGSNPINLSNGSGDDPDWQALGQPVVPTVDAGGPYFVNEGASVMLTASASDPDGGPVTVAWDLDGDGSFETSGMSASFSAAGLDGPIKRLVTARAMDDEGQIGTDTAQVSIRNVSSVVGPISAPAQPVPINTSVAVSASFTDAGVPDRHTATWAWGDGTTSPGKVIEAGGSGSISGSHIYRSPGTYVLQLTVVDDGGRTTVEYRSVVVNVPAAGP